MTVHMYATTSSIVLVFASKGPAGMRQEMLVTRRAEIVSGMGECAAAWATTIVARVMGAT